MYKIEGLGKFGGEPFVSTATSVKQFSSRGCKRIFLNATI